MSDPTDTVAHTLAGILSTYLKNNWSDSPLASKTITASTDMVGDLQLDSFQVMEFMLEVEDHFDTVIDLESLADVRTVTDLARVVRAAES